MLKILQKKKPLLIIFILFSLFLSGLIILSVIRNKYRPVKVRAKEIHFSVRKKEVAQLLKTALASGKNGHFVLGTESPIELEKESEKVKTDFQFNAIAPSWQFEEPDGDNIKVQIRTSVDGNKWTGWQDIEVDADGNAKDNIKPDRVYGNIIVKQAQFVQQKTVFKIRQIDELPEINDLKLTYVDSKEKKSLLDKVVDKISFLPTKVSAAAIPNNPTDQPDICSRTCWGADESIYVPGEDYSPTRKIIVHHTATSNSDNDPKATIRAIYYFHNIDRGWGDIGYNFLVDQNSGTIYEGRYGGDNVVGAHASGFNRGSVGVSVLGDFRYAKPNKKVQNALHKIAVWKIYSHNIDPREISTFGNPLKSMPVIDFHGDVGNTACAGTYLNNFISKLRTMSEYMPQQIVLRNSEGVRRITSANDLTVEDLLNIYRGQGNVDPNFLFKVDTFPSDGVTPPNDADYSFQWDLTKLDAINVWKDTTGGSPTVKVAVIDSGVAYENYDPPPVGENYTKAPDFVNTNFVAGYDFVNSDTHPNDDYGHGTSVASVIAESTNNSIGSASLAYNVAIMPIKVCSNLGLCSEYDSARAIDFAWENGAKVINLSFGGYNYSSVLQAAIDSAWNAGVVVVASAGNDNLSYIKYPAKLNHVIGVSSTDSNNVKSSFSNYGDGVDLAAPGSSVVYQKLTCSGLDCTTFSYNYISGTSFAAPLVSASAALVISKGTIWPDSVERYLKLTANDLGSSGWDTTFGWGLIRPVNSLSISDGAKPYPNGSLIRAVSDTKIYAIEGGLKRWIQGPDILLSRYNPNYIAVVPKINVDSYTDGAVVGFNNGVLLRSNSGAVYVLENGLKRWIRNPGAFTGLGYKAENIVPVSDTFLLTLGNGADIHTSTSVPNGSLIRAKNDQKVYLLESGQRRWIPGPAILLSKFNPKLIMDIDPTLASSYSLGSNVLYGDGSMLRDISSGTIYFISDGQKRWINHPMTLTDLGLNSINVFNSTGSELANYSTGQPLK